MQNQDDNQTSANTDAKPAKKVWEAPKLVKLDTGDAEFGGPPTTLNDAGFYS